MQALGRLRLPCWLAALSGVFGACTSPTPGAPGLPVESGGAAGGSTMAEAGAAGASYASDDELANVYNLVSAEAEAELIAYLSPTAPASRPLAEPGGLVLGVNGFLDAYLEDYDFVFLLLARATTSNTYGRSEPINRAILPGTGHDTGYRVPGYHTHGRLKAVAGFKYVAGQMGPFAHELLHYWANALDPSFGFGVGLDYDDPSHWGYADVHGQLGGYDGASLRCQTPAGALPPDCTPETSGRYRYVTDVFATNANGTDLPYAPLELYLMGLLPLAEVPDVHLLVNGDIVAPDNVSHSLIVEADGIHTLLLADIVARHGTVPPWPVAERSLRVALVVVSAEPAAPEVLAELAHYGAIFGNRATHPYLRSFEALTGGRVRLDTHLGRRRTPSDPPADAPAAPFCDVAAQDCEPAGATCALDGTIPVCELPAQ